jgi:hypothetical protein
MNWTLLVLFSFFGVVMGFLSVKGYTQRIEPFLWIAFMLIVALVFSKNIEYRLFLHGLLTGIAWGIINGGIQSYFFDSYVANNPAAHKNFEKITFVHPRYFVLITGPVIGAITGIVLGGLILLFRKFW